MENIKTAREVREERAEMKKTLSGEILTKGINADMTHSESMGFFHGERKEQIEKTENRLWEIIKEEGLSLTQAENVIRKLSGRIKREKQTTLANTKIK